MHDAQSDIDPPGAMRLANANAALWAIGNGLISTLLVIYLASDLGASLAWLIEPGARRVRELL